MCCHGKKHFETLTGFTMLITHIFNAIGVILRHLSFKNVIDNVRLGESKLKIVH